MFKWLKSRKKSLAEKTLDAMEKQRAHMTPAQVAAAEETFQRITKEVRASRVADGEIRLGVAQVHPGVRSK
jgi:hypothetical protein